MIKYLFLSLFLNFIFQAIILRIYSKSLADELKKHDEIIDRKLLVLKYYIDKITP